ncbi:MAG: HAD family hydrolase [Alloprevotella sp.]|nr:HAD family hydrolase [Alloprevotella sp.]
MVTTIIFDLDGTLIDTLQDLTNSANHALRLHGLPERSAADVRKFLGNGYARLMAECAGNVPEETTSRLLADFNAYYTIHCQDQTRPYHGIIKMLRELKGRGIRLGIVSNKGDAAVQELVGRFFSGLIDTAVGEREGIRRKPSPDTVLAALQVLGSKAEESIYVGDSEVDIETAKRAGMACVTCLWGFRDADFLLAHGATRTISSPEELLTAIG